MCVPSCIYEARKEVGADAPTQVYNKVVIRWTTHNPLGLSHKDVEMAKFCDEKGLDLGALTADRLLPAEETGAPGGNVLDSLLGQGVQECGPCAEAKKP